MDKLKLWPDEEILVKRLLHLMRSTETREQNTVIVAVTNLLDELEERFMVDPPKE